MISCHDAALACANAAAASASGVIDSSAPPKRRRTGVAIRPASASATGTRLPRSARGRPHPVAVGSSSARTSAACIRSTEELALRLTGVVVHGRVLHGRADVVPGGDTGLDLAGVIGLYGTLVGP